MVGQAARRGCWVRGLGTNTVEGRRRQGMVMNVYPLPPTIKELPLALGDQRCRKGDQTRRMSPNVAERRILGQ